MVKPKQGEDICPENKDGHFFTIKKYRYHYCEYCGVNQISNCPADKEYLELRILEKAQKAISELKDLVKAYKKNGLIEFEEAVEQILKEFEK